MAKYTLALGERICADLSNGKPLRQICREVGIDWSTVYAWRDRFPNFGKRLQLARDMGEEAIAAECLEIADTPLEGIETTEEATTVSNVDDAGELTMKPATLTKTKRGDMLGHRKLQIETRLKLLAKWNPSKWGDKVEQTHKGDPGAPVHLVVNGTDVHG
jgi:transposase-like protein